MDKDTGIENIQQGQKLRVERLLREINEMQSDMLDILDRNLKLQIKKRGTVCSLCGDGNPVDQIGTSASQTGTCQHGDIVYGRAVFTLLHRT